MDSVEIESIILDLTEKHLSRIHEHAGASAREAAEKAVKQAELRLQAKLDSSSGGLGMTPPDAFSMADDMVHLNKNVKILH